MNKPSAIFLALSAALLAGAAEGPERSHDVHELEKVSFTVTAVAADRKSGSVIYLRALTSADYDADGKSDEQILRVTCSGSSVSEAALWSAGASSWSKMGPGTGQSLSGSWGAATPQFRSLSPAYLKKKLDKSGLKGSSLQWVPVTLSGIDGLCPATTEVKATRSRSNIQNN